MTRNVLVVDDAAEVRDALCQTLGLGDLHAIAAASFIEAKDHITPDFDGIIISDIRMPGRDGFYLLDHTQGIDAALPVILLTGEGDIPMAVRAMGQGAFDFLEKPCAAAELLAVVERALRTRALVLENRRLKVQLETGDPAARMLFGTSAMAQELRARVRNVAAMHTEVLVTGAPGAGISKIAEVVHLISGDAGGPFVKLSAAGLLPARFEEAYAQAAGGSLFLDEVHLMPVETQFAALERVERRGAAGGSVGNKAGGEARIIAGSSADLSALAAQGAFHGDLFYRLDVMTVRIPSLAERPEDIPILFRQYVAQASEQAGLAAPEITPDYLSALMARDWPGNARSLMSAAMRFVLGMPEGNAEAAELGLSEQMARVERALLIAALGRQNGQASAAAKVLKVPRKTFYDKLARYGIRPEQYRR